MIKLNIFYPHSYDTTKNEVIIQDLEAKDGDICKDEKSGIEYKFKYNSDKSGLIQKKEGLKCYYKCGNDASYLDIGIDKDGKCKCEDKGMETNVNGKCILFPCFDPLGKSCSSNDPYVGKTAVGDSYCSCRIKNHQDSYYPIYKCGKAGYPACEKINKTNYQQLDPEKLLNNDFKDQIINYSYKRKDGDGDIKIYEVEGTEKDVINKLKKDTGYFSYPCSVNNDEHIDGATVGDEGKCVKCPKGMILNTDYKCRTIECIDPDTKKACSSPNIITDSNGEYVGCTCPLSKDDLKYYMKFPENL